MPKKKSDLVDFGNIKKIIATAVFSSLKILRKERNKGGILTKGGGYSNKKWL